MPTPSARATADWLPPNQAITDSVRIDGAYRIRYPKANDSLPRLQYSFRMETTVPPDLGSRIKAQREIRGWSQEELGRRISDLIGRQPGYGKAAVQKWESGMTTMPPADAIWAMEQLFQVPHDILLWGTDRKPPAPSRGATPGRRPGNPG